MRQRHLRAFGELEAERDQINAKLAGLAKQADQHGGDPALLDGLPMLGDLLPKLPDRIKQQLFEAFDVAMLYHKTDNQVTCWATITPATLAAIIAQSETPRPRRPPHQARSSFGSVTSPWAASSP